MSGNNDDSFKQGQQLGEITSEIKALNVTVQDMKRGLYMRVEEHGRIIPYIQGNLTLLNWLAGIVTTAVIGALVTIFFKIAFNAPHP